MLPIVTIDFESHPIENRPVYPPKPVGVSIGNGRVCGEPEVYYMAWGHPTENNCTEEQAFAELEAWFEEALAGRVQLLFHNMKFDLSICYEYFGLPILPWDAVHDTQYLLFLDNPHSKSLELKPAAQALLGWAPEERDAINDWVFENRKALAKQYGVKISTQKGKVSKLYEWFCRAPGGLVGAYADGDVKRTAGLFDLLYPRILEAGMGPAYDRLRRITPILMENERTGMRVDVPQLREDCATYTIAFDAVEAAIRMCLGTPDLNLDADADVAAALVAADAILPDMWVTTKTGDLSMSKDNLKPSAFRDPQLASALGYRNRLKTCLDMFMRPWLEQAQKNNGYITTNWNITRGGQGGTRTGRPSTNNHNFLNLSKDFEGRTDGYVHPDFLDVPALPLVRKYILPDEGHVFLHRDFSGQELRVFAHFEQADLYNAYIKDPATDPHAVVGAKMSEMMGQEFERTKVKVLNFQSLYGGGLPAIMNKLECDRNEAKVFQDFHSRALPGRKLLADVLEEVTSEGLPIRTWGGRLYYVEEASYSERFKRWMTWFYKLINYIVQGSAADLTIEAILDWYHHPDRDPRTRLLVTVYDEINISCPAEVEERQMQVLKEAMEKPRLSVPMLSDGKRGPAWGKLTKCA